MSSKGYVYILINPSMPGLLKIGKTNRLPEDRAKELSASTGVATPFIVVYKIQVNNCDECERYIHELLEEQGYRVNPSREFFEAEITDVINALNNYKNEHDDIEDDFEKVIDDNNLWRLEEKKGNEWYYGINDHVIDYGEAINHYKKAIKLGSETAYTKIGEIYISLGDMDEAFNILAEGIDKGFTECYKVLANYYFKLYENSYDKILFDDTYELDDNFEIYERSIYLDNAQRAFKSYLLDLLKIAGDNPDYILENSSFAYDFAIYLDNLRLNSSHGGKIDYEILKILKPAKDNIYEVLYKIYSPNFVNEKFDSFFNKV